MKKTGDKGQCSRIPNRAPLHYLLSRADPLQNLRLHFHCATYSPQSETRLFLPYKQEKTPNPLQQGQREGSWIKGLSPGNHCVKSVNYWSQSWFYFWWMVFRFMKCKVLPTLLHHHINLYIHEEIQALIPLNKLLTTNFTPLYLHLYLHRVNSIKDQADTEPLTAP